MEFSRGFKDDYAFHDVPTYRKADIAAFYLNKLSKSWYKSFMIGKKLFLEVI